MTVADVSSHGCRSKMLATKLSPPKCLKEDVAHEFDEAESDEVGETGQTRTPVKTRMRQEDALLMSKMI